MYAWFLRFSKVLTYVLDPYRLLSVCVKTARLGVLLLKQLAEVAQPAHRCLQTFLELIHQFCSEKLSRWQGNGLVHPVTLLHTIRDLRTWSETRDMKPQTVFS